LSPSRRLPTSRVSGRLLVCARAGNDRRRWWEICGRRVHAFAGKGDRFTNSGSAPPDVLIACSHWPVLRAAGQGGARRHSIDGLALILRLLVRRRASDSGLHRPGMAAARRCAAVAAATAAATPRRRPPRGFRLRRFERRPSATVARLNRSLRASRRHGPRARWHARGRCRA
jgi:hypothetical protein